MKTDCGGAARQGVGQADRGVGQGLAQLEGPLGHLGGQTARPFVSFVEVDVVKRDANAQRPDHLDLLVHRSQRLQ